MMIDELLGSLEIAYKDYKRYDCSPSPLTASHYESLVNSQAISVPKRFFTMMEIGYYHPRRRALVVPVKTCTGLTVYKNNKKDKDVFKEENK